MILALLPANEQIENQQRLGLFANLWKRQENQPTEENYAKIWAVLDYIYPSDREDRCKKLHGYYQSACQAGTLNYALRQRNKSLNEAADYLTSAQEKE